MLLVLLLLSQGLTSEQSSIPKLYHWKHLEIFQVISLCVTADHIRSQHIGQLTSGGHLVLNSETHVMLSILSQRIGQLIPGPSHVNVWSTWWFANEIMMMMQCFSWIINKKKIYYILYIIIIITTTTTSSSLLSSYYGYYYLSPLQSTVFLFFKVRVVRCKCGQINNILWYCRGINENI